MQQHRYLPFLLIVAIAIVDLVQPGHSWVPTTRRPLSTRRKTTASLAVLTAQQLQSLEENKFVVIPNFLEHAHQGDLRKDIQDLRSTSKFKIAKIGQDSTNTLNTDIRVAETCFLGSSIESNSVRQSLYATMDSVRADLMRHFGVSLDASLTELLYAYYPQGGFYRRHRDAIPNSASTLRKYSLLLYLNEAWGTTDGGELRLHFDGGGDSCPEGVDPDYMDVQPNGGTLVLFQSDAIPHEVLDTNKERMAIVGWYNRPVQASDALELSQGSPMQVAMLAVAAGLVTVGAASLLS